jgi:hypothetical protein
MRPGDDEGSRQQRLALIKRIQAQGTSLLSAATDDAMKTRIQLAMVDLDIAVNWLHQEVELQSEVLRVIDNTIDVATRNMAIVARALDDRRSETD